MEKKKDLGWLFLLLLVLGVLILLFSGHDNSSSGNSIGANSPEKMRLVNKHLKETAINLEKEKMQRKLETSKELQKYSNSSQQSFYQPNESLNFDSDQNMASLTHELDRSQVLDEGSLTPEQIIQRKLYENERLQKEDEAYREAYAAQFIENARRGGWDIKLGPNFEVLSVRKIPENQRNPSNLFDSTSGGSR